ncbi:MAG: LuxR C-terminal-related transcriptional regulator [Acidimicrobiia bacterium]
MTDHSDALLAEGRAALRSGDAVAARSAFEAATTDPPSGAVLEGLARCSYIELRFQDAIAGWERAYATFRECDDRLGAVRVARTLAYMHGSINGDGAVMGGWIARAQSLLGNDSDSAEAGWVTLNAGMFAGDRAHKHELFSRALELGRRWDDSDLEFVALAYLGASLVHADQTEEGMTFLDEALAAVAGSDVDDFCVLQEIFCQLFAACERAQDISRADQWIRIGEAIAARRDLPAVSAFCRTHYGGVLTAAGRWTEADVALTDAVQLWALGHRTLRGGALARLADLRVRQGRFEEAEQLLEGLEGHEDATRPLAAIQLSKGETSRAKETIERALDRADVTSSAVVPLLMLLVDVHLAAGTVDEAGDAVHLLVACAELHPSDYSRACAALARGRLCLATGTGDPRTCLREALAGFDRARLPMELAHSRLELANALVDTQPEVALAEARAALDAFEKLQAARHADAAAARLRSLGARPTTGGRGDGILTKREAEVLELLGHGLSNPDISDRLFISRKTVEHHVGNVLAKLGLRSRAEAAAYATRAKQGAE